MYVAEHVKRLFQGAKAIDMDVGVSPEGLIKMMYDTVDANEMHEGVHIRLMVTRVSNRRRTRIRRLRLVNRP